MRINHVLAILFTAIAILIAGCTSPSPSPSPGISTTPSPTAIVNASPSVTVTPAPNVTLTPTPAATVMTPTPTATPSIVPGQAIIASDFSIDWDTLDIMQHDTAHLKIKSNASGMLLDVDVIYMVTTPTVILNPDNTTVTSNQTATNRVQIGKMSPGETKSITIQSPDHKKNVPATIQILVNWREGTRTVFETVLSVPDYSFGTKTY